MFKVVTQRRIKSTAGLFVLLGLSACASLEMPETKVAHLSNGFYVLSDTAATSQSTLLKVGTGMQLCTSPPPDATFSQTESGGFSLQLLNYGGSDDLAAESEDSNENEMFGRSPGVLLARELMFRLCEMGRNLNLSSDQMVSLYQQNLKVISAVTVQEAQNTRISLKDQMSVTEAVTGSLLGPVKISATAAVKRSSSQHQYQDQYQDQYQNQKDHSSGNAQDCDDSMTWNYDEQACIPY